MSAQKLEECFVVLSEETDDLYAVRTVERISKPTPLEFYRNYVAQNKPVIITDACKHWKALSRWSNDYLRQKIGHTTVTVDVTPTGHGDTVVDGKYFVKPEERSMKFSEYLDIVEKKVPSNGVFYIQHQNGNFQTEFSELSDDVDAEVKWVSEALGAKPDVVNFWMGPKEAVSSCHKDHYENMYVVVAGEKIFTLMPPTDYHFLYQTPYREGRYRETKQNNNESNNNNNGNSSNGSNNNSSDKDNRKTVNGFVIEEEDSEVPWIPVDPDAPDLEKFPLFKHAHPVQCRVRPGEMLYLPAMWYHKVQQGEDKEGRTIAVNYWYDMTYSAGWCYYRFMEGVSDCVRQMHLTETTSTNNSNTNSNNTNDMSQVD